MKWIKRIDESTDYKSFKEISVDESLKLKFNKYSVNGNAIITSSDTHCKEFMDNNWITFTTNEIDKLKEANDKLELTMPLNVLKGGEGCELSISGRIAISKLKDEWYYINYKKYKSGSKWRFFQCDQLSGVMDCLKFLNFINEPSNLVEPFIKIEYDEQIKGKFGDNLYYLDLNNEEIHKFINDNWEKFTELEIKNVKKFSDRFKVSSPLYEEDKDTPVEKEKYFLEIGKGCELLIDNLISISKLKDEWYYVNVKDITRHNWYYYKCDQFDSLIKLLEYLNIDNLNESHINEYNLYNEIDNIKSMIDKYGSETMPSNEDTFIKNNWLQFNNKEIIEIQSLFPGIKIESKISGDIKISNCYLRIFNKINISKLKDEWYYVSINSDNYNMSKKTRNVWKYYKCDQFTGLMKCLNDIHDSKFNESIEFKDKLYIGSTYNLNKEKGVANIATEHEFQILKSLFDGMYPGYTIDRHKMSNDDIYYYIVYDDGNTESTEEDWFIGFHNDEWITVSYAINNMIDYYLCDTTNGLVNLVNDLYNKKYSKINENLFYKEIDETEQLIGKYGTINVSSSTEILPFVKDNWLSFSDEEFEKIKEIIPNISSDYPPARTLKGNPLSRLKVNGLINMVKMKDEWYYVNYYGDKGWSFFKCDQFGGLMRWLKEVYKAPINESKSNILFKEIYSDELMISNFGATSLSVDDDSLISDFMLDKWIAFTPDEVEAVKKYFPNMGFGSPANNELIANKYKQLAAFGITINKLKDEWYYVSFYKPRSPHRSRSISKWVYYKCDQFDGLIQCLQSISSINESVDIEEPLYYNMGSYEYKTMKFGSSTLRPGSLKFINDNWYTFSNYEVEEINKISDIELFQIKYSFVPVDYVCNSIVVEDQKITIIKLKDDWFVVELKNYVETKWASNIPISDYYKCDGFDGLLKFLSDLKEHHKSNPITESITHEPYQLISYELFDGILLGDSNNNIDEMARFAENHWVSFTRNEIDIITKEINIWVNETTIRGCSKTFIYSDKLAIYKLVDEWFYVKITKKVGSNVVRSYHYKCDQWDGLIKCLKEKYIVK